MATTMSALPVQDRPRERLLALGAGALSDQELLAILLRSGTRGTGAPELAASLLSAHGGVHVSPRYCPRNWPPRPGLDSRRPRHWSPRSSSGAALGTPRRRW